MPTRRSDSVPKRRPGRGLRDVHCIGPFHVDRLARLNVRTTDDLLRLCRRRPQREALGDVTGLGEESLLRWARIADLMQIDGICSAAAEALLAAGLGSTGQVGRARPEVVLAAVAGVETETTPTRDEAEAWVRTARELATELE